MIRLYLFLVLITLASAVEKAADRPASMLENNATVTTVAANRMAQEEEKLRLMFQVFTYSSDLNNAYKVGKRALKLFPDSLYWHQKMAEISEWIDKRNEAIQHYQFIYHRTHDRKLRKKILDYSLAAYQYETAAPILEEIALSDPNEKNLANVVDIYNKTGSPEKAAEMLEHLALKKEINATLAAKALKLYTEIGEETSAKALVEKLEKVKWYDMYTAKIIGDYYLAKKDPESAYRIMQKVKPETLKEHAQAYYRWMSDMGWYLQKFKAAASASKALYEAGEAQPQDYERILFYFRDKNTQLVGRVSYDAYRKLGKKYLYINYLDTLMRQKLYGRLIDEVQKAFHEDIGSALKSEVYVWLMLGQAYAEEKAYAKSIAA
jgi:nitroreductase